MTRLLRWIDVRMATPIYETVLPAGAGAPPARGDFLSGLARAAPPLVVTANVAAVLAISLLPPLLIGRARLFQSLEPEARERCLERLQAHRFYPFRMLLNIVKLS